MAGPTVTLNFAGDSSDLRKDFDRIGGSADGMNRKIDRGSRDMAGGLDRVGEASDTLDTRMMGSRDLMTGVGDTMRGLKEGDMLLLATGLGDLGSAGFNLVIPMFKSLITRIAGTTLATKAAAIATGALNAVMAISPIGLVVIALAALAAGLVIAWKNSETFRNIVRGAFNVVKRVIDFVVDSTVARFRFWFDTISNIAGGVIGVFQSIGRAIGDAFQSAFDFVRRLWNNTVGGFGFSVPRWIPGIGGRSFHIPNMQTGGIVPGTPGQPQLVLAHGGERITRASEAGRPSVISIALMLDGKQIAGAVVDPVRRSLLRTTGRNVNLGLA